MESTCLRLLDGRIYCPEPKVPDHTLCAEHAAEQARIGAANKAQAAVTAAKEAVVEAVMERHAAMKTRAGATHKHSEREYRACEALLAARARLAEVPDA